MTDNHSSVSGQVASRKNGQRFDRCIEGLFANSDHHHHHQHHRHQHHDDHHQNNHHNHHNHHTSYQWFLIDLHFCQGFYQGIGHGAHVRMEGTLAFGMMGLCRMESSMCLTPDATMLQDTVDGSELRRSSPGMYKTL